jgi:hypothetical protein
VKVKLRYVLGIPFAVVIVDVVAVYLAQHLSGHGLGDTVYWGTALPWLFKAIWFAGFTACAIALLLVTPVVLIVRAMRKWPVLIGPKTRDTPDQRRALARRGPRF